MDNENSIRLSGPFRVTDSLGRVWDIHGIRIFDEGYAIIDVFVDFAEPMDDAALHDDARVIAQIIARLRALGYAGPDFGPGDPGLQDERLLVLEAPEEFGRFAAGKGWRNLAEAYADDQREVTTTDDALADPLASAVFAALLRRVKTC